MKKVCKTCPFRKKDHIKVVNIHELVKSVERGGKNMCHSFGFGKSEVPCEGRKEFLCKNNEEIFDDTEIMIDSHESSNESKFYVIF